MNAFTNGITDREMQILKLISQECTTSEIARQLYLSCETVRTHRKHLLEKLAARNVAGLIRRAFEEHILVIRSSSFQGNIK